MKSQLLPVFLLLLASVSGGCVIDTCSRVERSGRPFSRETLEQITPGRSPEFVESLLGPPTTRATPDPKSEIWKWEYRSKEHRSGSVILVLDTDKTTEVRSTTYVLFEGGAVAKVWQD